MELVQGGFIFIWELKTLPFIIMIGMLLVASVMTAIVSILSLTIRLCFAIVKVTRKDLWYPMKETIGNTIIQWRSKTQVLAWEPLLLRKWKTLSRRYVGT